MNRDEPAEDWKNLALRLRKQLDENDEGWRRLLVAALAIGFVVGAVAMWLTIRFHLWVR